jgi:hypothetical protein
MIRLKRSRRADDVPPGLQGEKRREKEMKLLRRAAGGGPFDDAFWDSIRAYWKPAREPLFRETQWKCAYCESIKERDREGDVEHFRPKSVYWWLACCYDNYLFACKICNSDWKGNAFPIDGPPLSAPCCLPGMDDTSLEKLVGTCTPDPLGRGKGLTMKAFRAVCQAEQPRLLDPYLIDPEPFFKWIANPAGTEPDGTTHWHVEVAPRNNRPRARLVFDAARDYYGLNRESLQDLRGRIYAHLLHLKQILETIDRIAQPVAWNETVGGLKGMTSARSPYTGMVRYFVYDEWKLLKRK